MNTLLDNCAGSVIFQSSSLRDIGNEISKRVTGKVFVICDSNTRKHCYTLINKHLPEHIVIGIPAGEKHKTLQTVEKIWNTLLKHNADRNALIIGLGGGIVCDISGFAASIYKRGIRSIYIPTTVLAQADAAIGGKTGVDFKGIKNMLGTFYQPEAVFIHYSFIKTLPGIHINNGMAEIIKVSIALQPDLFDDVLNKKAVSLTMVQKAIHVKCSIVNEDIADNNIRKVLNFGHTIGHAIESVFLHKKPTLLHGEAVALGMIGEAYLSHIKTGMPIEDLDDILFSINKWDLVKKVSIMKYFNDIKRNCHHDKKNMANKTQCILLEEIGVPLIDVTISDSELEQACVFIDNYIQSV